MKKHMIVVAVCMTTSLTFAQKIQEKDVPASLRAAFQKHYPEAKEVQWEKEKGNYEVEFTQKQNEYSVLMDAAGNILETEMEIPADQLPAAVKEYISKNYPGEKIKEAARITDSKGSITYEAEVKGKDLLFDSKGTYLKSEEEDEKEDDDASEKH